MSDLVNAMTNAEGISSTGFCWRCGYACPRIALFCSEPCQRAYERAQRAEANRLIHRGKRANYGPTGV